MRELVAKKYVNALMQSLREDELDAFASSLHQLSMAYGIAKFQTIIHSCEISASKKEELLLSMVSSPSPKLINLIKLLSANDRLAILPDIAQGLDYQLSIKKNSFEGSVVGMFELTQEQLNELETSFGKRFGATIHLASRKSDYPGIKIELEDLGIEVSFSVERLKSQLTEHILKAI
ncbi:MAG: F0F1 ATP synthase subunit delta [Campylobacterales bacterium]|nr:F0F1 ATP synthase subunit delta [Campylobacterales bacterium]